MQQDHFSSGLIVSIRIIFIRNLALIRIVVGSVLEMYDFGEMCFCCQQFPVESESINICRFPMSHVELDSVVPLY